MKCPNCGTTYTCGCQKRVLANGKTACTSCYNKSNKEETKEIKNLTSDKTD